MKPIVLSMTCYGERYINSFFNYTLPSLLSAGNLAALMKVRDVRMIVHTDESGGHNFRDKGFTPICNIMEGDKYEQIGIHQRVDLEIAKERGADYHLLMPDFVYSENCFIGMMEAVKKGHKAIARLVVSTTEETIASEINRHRTALDLANLSLRHIHPGVKHWLADRDGLPNTHVIAWETANTLRMCSPHVTPIYIANEAIKLDGPNLPLDCILDSVIDGDIYFTKPEDEMVIVEVSPQDSRQSNDERIDLKEFIRIMKVSTKNSSIQQSLFFQETVDAINGNGRWNDVEISEQKDMIRHALDI